MHNKLMKHTTKKYEKRQQKNSKIYSYETHKVKFTPTFEKQFKQTKKPKTILKRWPHPIKRFLQIG